MKSCVHSGCPNEGTNVCLTNNDCYEKRAGWEEDAEKVVRLQERVNQLEAEVVRLQTQIDYIREGSMTN